MKEIINRASKAINAELKRLARVHNGKLTAEIVVNAAKPESSPLHNRFTWDDTDAARSWRLYEARKLISVCVEYLPCGKGDLPTRVFVSLTDERKEGGSPFRLVTQVMSDKDRRKKLLEDAQWEMGAFVQKFGILHELATVVRPMRKFLSKRGK